MLGVNGDGMVDAVALAGMMTDVFMPGCPVSNLVIAKPVGTLLDPLALRFFDIGRPDGVEGDACGDGWRGVIVAEVV